MAVELPRRRFTIDDYYRMTEAGILTEDDRVELLDGEIVEMAPPGDDHEEYSDALLRELILAVGTRARVRSQNRVRLSDLSEPLPDVAVVRNRSYGRGSGPPLPEDVYALFEVSDSSLAIDLRTKARLYALAGIREYVVVDVPHQEVVRHRGPRDGEYRQVERLGRDAVVTLLALPEVTIRFAEVFG